MAETEKERLLKQLAQLKNERTSFEPHWRDLSDFINPRGSRFLTSDVNRDDRRNTKIVDPTGSMAQRILSSGMMSGITSPARPWFKLATPDPDMMDYGPVKVWLEVVQRRMNEVFNKSNLYQSLPVMYASLGTFGTAAMAVLEDDQDVIRTMPFPIGSYYLANSPRGSVDTSFRQFSMTVRRLAAESMIGHCAPRSKNFTVRRSCGMMLPNPLKMIGQRKFSAVRSRTCRNPRPGPSHDRFRPGPARCRPWSPPGRCWNGMRRHGPRPRRRCRSGR